MSSKKNNGNRGKDNRTVVDFIQACEKQNSQNPIDLYDMKISPQIINLHQGLDQSHSSMIVPYQMEAMKSGRNKGIKCCINSQNIENLDYDLLKNNLEDKGFNVKKHGKTIHIATNNIK